ncbi:hypothetical protein KYC_27963 [Achromobacter arsenitoxydans SY8]|uniref:Uncharacterized protein n=1 Tax=Achromobacter arsenitoxydans SY8 TaxID=477184 RepID=H0FFM3_9BURK|nr:hypothetical protein KYC_27963 [Achromobacter arsenitoxydans SY8]
MRGAVSGASVGVPLKVQACMRTEESETAAAGAARRSASRRGFR